ncbi:Cna B-type domain-containing protein [Streptococcus ruminantium]|uniref:Cna B-type domain-containing protein n=5 Tax=Streptococcus ruminantium TaxID=1917441 RepID=UPI001F21F653|nr:Cna B-type domain-containing protein [Streptococcus ruminantium]BDD43488.1 cell wall anchor [Streptococcus ruminantium]
MKTGLKSRFKTIVMLFCLLFQVFAPASTALAEEAPKEVETTITSLKVLRTHNGEETDNVFYNGRFYLALDWDASGHGAELRKGDYFEVTLPDAMRFPENSAAVDFPLHAPDGSVVANAHVTPNPDGGGKVRATFTDYVQNKYNVKGSMQLAANFVNSKVRRNEENTFSITVSGKVHTIKVRPNGPTDLKNEKLNKWSKEIGGNRVQWEGRINHEKGSFPDDTVFSDTLALNSPEKFIKDTFRLQRVEFDSVGNPIKVLETISSDKISFSNDDRTVTVKLGNISNQQYYFTYQTSYTPDTVIKNNVKLTSKDKVLAEHSASYINSSSGGTGSGDLTNKIKIIKVDAENQETKLANAKFKITNVANGKEYEVTTNAQGEAVTEKLVAGQYKIKELTAPNGFELNPEETTVSVADGKATIQTITNKPIKTSVSVDKKWVGPAKDSATVRLYADDADTGKTATLNASNSWKATFNDLRKFHADGKEIKYTIKEDAIENYQSEVTGDMASGFTVTNTNIEKVSVPVTKTWNDNNDQDGKRPQSITVNLLADGKVIKSQQVTAENDWKYTFTDLPKYANGKEIVYTVTENAVEGYTTTYDKYNITNSYTPGQTSLTVTKAWDDKDNQDGKRPEAIQVQLYANGEKLGEPVTLTADNKWTHTWTGLAKKANKKDIVYTVKEVSKVEGYTTTVGTVENGNVTITNTYKPSTTSIKVNKVWKDKDNQDGLRPTSITVNLLADGEVVKTETITPNADGDWSHTFTDLPEYKNGKKITYTVSEEKVEGYETTVEGTTITNTHTPETTEVAGTKTWNDNNDQDGKRPKSITVNLLADGQPVASKIVTADDNWAYKFSNLPAKKNGAAITYTISEKAVADYTTTYDGYNITNSYTPGETSVTATKVWEDNNNQDGLRKEIKLELYADSVATGQVQTLSEENNWKATWTGLAKKANKKDIVYTVKEVTAIDGYTSKVTQTSTNNFTITNTHTPETTQVSGTKTWNDNNDQDGKRPKSITVNLLANGEVVQSQKVSADTNWTYTFTNLPKYANGKEIVYTVSEEKVDGYEMKVEGTNITNTHTPETTEVAGTKTWNDNNDQDGKRPKSITVNLLADGKVIKSQQVTAENDWKYTFTDLPKYANGKEIVYTVSEEKVDGYEMKVDGYNITNSYTPSTTSVKVNKVWKDKDNQDGLRPTSIIVNLLADGQVVSTTTIKPDTNGDWNYTFTDLPEYKNGKKIAYTVEEANTPNGYTSSVEGTTITNTHTPETTEVAGTKTWNDNNDQDGKRPKSITVNLLANGEVVQSQKVTADNNWTYTFTNLPKYANGKEIVYTVTENAVDNYTTTIDGHNITNSYTPGQTSLTVTKIWKDNNNQDGKRPGSIQVQLYANGEKLGEPITLTADNKWTHTWTGLDKKANQKDIVYTVKEVSVVDGYTASVGKVENGNVTITNTYKPTTPPKKKKSTPLPSTGSLSGLGLTLVGLALAATISARAIYRKRK